MNNQLFTLYKQLNGAEGLSRLTIIQEFISMPAFLGDNKELEFLTESERLAIEIGSQNDKAMAQYQLGRYYLRMGSFETAVGNLNQAAISYSNAGDIHGAIDCEVALSEIDFKRSFNTGAIEKAENVLQLAKDNSYQAGMGSAWYILGWVYSAQGNYTEALRLYSLAMSAYEKAVAGQ